jgi:lactoylglutathione lyase
MKALSIFTSVLVLSLAQASGSRDAAQNSTSDTDQAMDLGNSSFSLAVKDIKASREFYMKLGFEVAGGDPEQNWQVLRCGDTTVGLFQGMFEKNIMTFNPGWSPQAEKLDQYTDVREIQRVFKERGVEFTTEADESTTGPASFVLEDPDGNTILFDQHVD